MGIENMEEVGRGTFAKVMKGVLDGQMVAVKIMHLEDNNALELSSDFYKEVWLMSCMRHMNLVQLVAVVESPLAMVMEYMSDGDLYTYLHTPACELPWERVMQFALDIAWGMRYLHSFVPPICHRDLKSPNVLLTQDKALNRLTAKVADFGLSRAATGELTRKVVDNPRWLAPEILKQHGHNETSDVFSYGMIMWELLTREDIWQSENWDYRVEERVIRGERPPIPSSADREYSDLMCRCWSGLPALRPTFDEIARALDDKKTGRTVGWEDFLRETEKPSGKGRKEETWMEALTSTTQTESWIDVLRATK